MPTITTGNKGTGGAKVRGGDMSMKGREAGNESILDR